MLEPEVMANSKETVSSRHNRADALKELTEAVVACTKLTRVPASQVL